MENKNFREESLTNRIELENSKNANKKKLFNFNFKNKLLKTNLAKKICGNFSDKVYVNSININNNLIPESFNNMKILFLSDLHLDVKPNSLDYIKSLNIPDYDILVFGGDFFDKSKFNENDIQDFCNLFNILKSKYNYAILGNHDSCKLVEKLEKDIDIKFLINENIEIKKNNEVINITGIDDITYFNSQYHKKCLLNNRNIFNIIVSHNPDFLEISEEYNYNLQLSGHTHGGQIILPFNFILFPHTKYKFAISGKWKYKNLQGITTSGFGCSGFALRNINPELVLITLKKI